MPSLEASDYCHSDQLSFVQQQDTDHEDKFEPFVSGLNVWKGGAVRDLKVVMKK